MAPWEARQRAFVERFDRDQPLALESGTLVVLPSATFAVAELRKVTGIPYYEHRMLYTTLLLRNPDLRLVYLTSLPVDPDVVDYYLRFLPDPVSARSRLALVTLDDPSPLPLTEKLRHRPEVVEQVRALAGPVEQAYVLPFNVTVAEHALSDMLELPLYGPHPDLVPLGSKSGSRRVAKRAGVPVLDGSEALASLDEVEEAVQLLRRRRPDATAAVIKLNDGFSGQGNAIVDLAGLTSPLPLTPTMFCAEEESWPTFGAKLGQGGGIVEELLRVDGLVSPSVQVRISPSGTFEVISSHDQVLGGPGSQVYLGCRFPADPAYRLQIQEAALAVAEVLAGEGVIGSFGIDFLVVPGLSLPQVFLSEINLRLGGTTHPYWMTRLVTGGTFDAAAGELVVDGRPTRYVATDNLRSEVLIGRTPGEVIQAVDDSGIAYDPATATGVCLHLLGAVPRYGKMGATCIAGDLATADALAAELSHVLTG